MRRPCGKINGWIWKAGIITSITIVFLIIKSHYTMLSVPFKMDIENSENDEFAMQKVKEYSWSKIDKDTFVLSAYWETRDVPAAPFVRFIAITRRLGNREENCTCVLKYDNDEVSYVRVVKEVINENWDKFHSAVFLICVSKNITTPPLEAKISCGNSETEWKTVFMLSGSSSPGKLAVCVRPFFDNFRDTFQLAEFVAYYDLMGVSRFTFYDQDTSDETKNYIGELQKELNIDFLPWALPSKMSAWQMGQLAFTQECFYKHMREYEFVAIVDVDEFLVLQENITLLDLVKEAYAKTGSIVFRNSFFCKGNSTSKETKTLTTLSWITRTGLYFPHIRSKVIARSAAVIHGNIHFVEDLVKGFEERVLLPKEGFLHHYKKDQSYCASEPVTVDTTALKFEENLRQHVAIKVYEEMRKRNALIATIQKLNKH